MKKDIHPAMGLALFRDASTGDRWLCSTTKLDGPKEEFEGKEYPVIVLETSSYSHPFYTGTQQFLDSAGRVEKFRKRFAAFDSSDNG